MALVQKSTLLVVALVLILCAFTASESRSANRCISTCVSLYGKIVTLKYRGYGPLTAKYLVFQRSKRYCRGIKLSDEKCRQLTDKMLEDTENGASAICSEAKVCKQAPVQGVSKSCTICSSLKSIVPVPLQTVNKSLSVIKKHMKAACQGSLTKEKIAQCNFVLSSLGSLPISDFLGMNSGVCEKLLCNNAAKFALKFLPKSESACRLCHQVLNISLDAISSSKELVGKILKDVLALCKEEACVIAVQRTQAIFDLVLKRLQVTDLCEAVGVCPGDGVFQPVFQMFSSSGKCSVCDNAEKVKKEMMPKYTKAISEIKTFVDKACTGAASEELSRKCAVVAPLLNVAKKDFGGVASSRNCEALLCNQGVKLLKNIFPRNEQSCSLCRSIAKIVQNGIVGMNGLVNNILKNVDGICDSLSQASAKAMCHKSVGETRKIYAYVASKLNDTGICKELGFCSKIQMAEDSTPSINAMFGLMKTALQSGRPVKSCPACDIVSGVMTVVTALSGPSVSKLNTQINAKCANVSGEMKIKCLGVQKAMSMLNISALPIMGKCQDIMCNSVVNKLFGILPKSTAACKICLSSMKIATDALQQVNVMVDGILAQVAEICTDTKCKEAIAETKKIFEYVLKKIDFSSVCKDLQLCKESDTKGVFKAAKIDQETPKKCPVCDRFEAGISEGLKKVTSNIKQLSQQVSQVCADSKNYDVKQKCASVEPLTKVLRNAIPSDLKMDLCRSYMCSNNWMMKIKLMSGSSCTMCKKVVKVVSTSLDDAKTMIVNILTQVDSLCSTLESEKAKQICHLSVKETRVGLELLIKMLEPGTVCKDLGFCSSSPSPFSSIFSQVRQFVNGGQAKKMMGGFFKLFQ